MSQPQPAVQETLKLVGSEYGGPSHLSAGAVATDDQDRTVISVINMVTGQHWQLIVQPLPSIPAEHIAAEKARLSG
jgi:hypothetical protein